jgi:HK97 family phage portal protein
MNTLTIGQYVKARTAGALRSWIGNWPASEFPTIFGGGAATSTGVAVSEWTALNYSAVWAAIATISGDVASLPLPLYKLTKNGGKERYVDSKLYELLHDAPNPEMTSMVFRETLQAHALSWGGGFAEIERDQLDRPKALWPLTPDRVTPFRERDGTRRLRYRITNMNGGNDYLEPRDMLHIPGLGFDGVTGYSVVHQARESIGLGLATEAFGGTFFGNGTTFGGVLTFPTRLNQELKAGIRESIDAVHGGVNRAHKIAIFGSEAGGPKFEKTGIPPNDAQFLETRKFQVTEIARWFGIPPHKLGDLERATFSNIEQQDIEYYRSCLRRWLVRWEQELNRKLISPLERKQQFFKHNAEGILRGDSAARASFYTAMFNIGAYSINKILESEDENPIGPEGDVHFVQVNVQPAELAMEGPQPQALPSAPDVKQLGPVKDAEVEEEDERSRRILAEIATRTAAIETGLTAQRDALTAEEREAHAAAVSRLEAERANLQVAFDEHREAHAAEVERRAAAEALATEEAAKRAAADAAAATAQAERELAIGRAAESDTAAAAALRAKELADTALAEAQARVTTQRDAEAQRLTAMLTAHRALIVHAVGRVVRRETDRARRHQASAEKLRQWMQSFYVTHEDDCVDELRPVVRAHLAWKQSSEDVDTVTLALVREHIAESQRQLRAVVDGEPEDLHSNLERMLLKWEQQRPEALADRVLEKDIHHVRSLR